ncbi:MAG TPA: hypothetical protein VNN73_20230 [Blastocatellia bacterium]|nr:hypothetical protein [Blastocatellia bacterium]
MRCPRCYSNIPDEAAACPDCHLPKPKNSYGIKKKGIVPANRSASQEATLTTKESARTRKANPQGRVSAGRFAVLVGIPLIASLIAAAVYLFVLPALEGGEIEPQTAMMAVDRLRHLPSNDAGLTVDERMMWEIEKARREGNLRGYQGWTVKPVKGDKMKVLIAFSFDQKDNTQQRAEWLADLAQNTFTPQTELAAAVFNR